MAQFRYRLFHRDCLWALEKMPENCIDSIVTDPPYGLGFMGKKWDKLPPSKDVFKEALRVLKPGGHLLAFGGSRTYHRLACAVEDAGFEIRDQIMWMYGTGFPKSQNVSKFIDKAAGAEREVVGVKPGHENFANRDSIKAVTRDNGSQDGFDRPWMHDEEKRKAYHMQTAPATDKAKQWEGWGTALKPAHEPIVVARKPLDGTVAANVLKHGTGALNINECRVGFADNDDPRVGKNYSHNASPDYTPSLKKDNSKGNEQTLHNTQGRWPANVIHDGSEEVLAGFPDSVSTGGQASLGAFRDGKVYGAGRNEVEKRNPGYGDSGSAARFFYCAKATKADRTESGRIENKHPTVKPNSLMRYLCRLVTPPGGVVLDPFMGSGSTGKAALQEGFRFIGIDDDLESYKIASKRLESLDTTENAT